MNEKVWLEKLDDLISVIDGIGLNRMSASAPPGTTEMIAIQLKELNATLENICQVLTRIEEHIEAKHD